MFANDGTNIFEKENDMGESSFFSRFGLKMRRAGGSRRALPVKPNQGLDLSIFSPARPGLATGLTGRAGQRSCSPRKKFLARAQPEILFLAILHYKTHERPEI
jgi:hypothetical protein